MKKLDIINITSEKREVIMIEKLFELVDMKSEGYQNFLKNICSYEARAFDKKEIDKMVDYIEAFSVSKGFAVKKTPFEKCGDFLTIDINEGNEKGNVFLAHMDTVHDKGVFGYPCVKTENDKMIGPGTIDCKGGIAIALLSMEALKEINYKKHTRLVLTSDEEISNTLGGEIEQEFIKNSVNGFKRALNCETTKGDEVVVSRKGILRKEISITGKGGHSGIDYFNSSSAVLEAANKIIELEKLSTFGKVTYNCSIINGGSVANCIPDKCTFTVDVRVSSNQDMINAENAIKKIAQTCYVKGTSAEVKDISSRIPMVRNSDTERLFEQMQVISQKYKLGELIPVESGGGSDSAYTQAAGVPSLCGLGGSGGNVHTNKEYIELKSISKRAKLLSAFCLEY